MSSPTTTWKKVAVLGGVLCGLGELALSPTMDGAFGIGLALAFGVAFLVGATWAWQARLRGAVLVTVLAAIELAFVPMYERTSTWEWVTQGSFAVASAIALVGGIGLIVELRRGGRTAAVSPTVWG